MRKLLLASSLAVLVLLSACDSGDSDDGSRPGDVAGTYLFTEFTFDPDGSAVAPIVVLDTLDQSTTRLLLSTGGNFILTYHFLSGDLYFLNGRFDVSDRAVELNVDDGDVDLSALLLADQMTLRRDPEQPDVLASSIRVTIENPAEYSDRYEGVGSLTGSLNLRLERQ